MSRPLRPHASARSTAMIVAGALVVALGGLAIVRSQSPAPQRSVIKAAASSGRLQDGPVRVRSGRQRLLRISGSLSARLAPGLSSPLDLVLGNPNSVWVTVRSLSVRIRTIFAPRADAHHPCTAGDFSVIQFSGRALRLRPGSGTSLMRLGVAEARWPHIGMLDRAVNQDGCKSARLTLAYRGLARQ